MLAIFKREFKAFFTNPLGFVILAVCYFFTGLMFSNYYGAGLPYVEYSIIGIAQILIFIIPVITMRLFSDERRQKTDQVLFTSPVKLISIVLGKFFAALVLYIMGFIPTIFYEIIVLSHVTVNVFYYIYALIGIILFGAALIAIGMFISAITDGPIMSIVITLVVNIFILFAGALASYITAPTATNWFTTAVAWVVERFSAFINGMNFLSVLESFGEQVFVLKDIVYFASIAVAFIFLTERALEKRRWS